MVMPAPGRNLCILLYNIARRNELGRHPVLTFWGNPVYDRCSRWKLKKPFGSQFCQAALRVHLI